MTAWYVALTLLALRDELNDKYPGRDHASDAVSEGHPFFAVGYGQTPEGHNRSPDEEVSVHGGLTYADFCAESEDGEGFGICHVPFDGRPDKVWWFGFDTGHAFDLNPGQLVPDSGWGSPWPESVYRDVSYVEDECNKLALQLKAFSTCSRKGCGHALKSHDPHGCVICRCGNVQSREWAQV